MNHGFLFTLKMQSKAFINMFVNNTATTNNNNDHNLPHYCPSYFMIYKSLYQVYISNLGINYTKYANCP